MGEVIELEKTILEKREQGVLILTLNRPECLNAFDDALNQQFLLALKRAEKDQTVRCLVITGEGKAFSAGQDLRSRSISAGNGAKPSLGESIRTRYKPMIESIIRLEKPVIAMVNGVAAGAGASLAFACDLRIVSEQASFIQAFIKVGLIPDSGACWLLPRLIGLGRAYELMMTGDKIDADTAMAYGLANRIVPADQLYTETMALAHRLAQSPTKAMGLMKRAVNKALSSDIVSYLDMEADFQEIAGQTADYSEGVAAFLEKRPAQFTGQ